MTARPRPPTAADAYTAADAILERREKHRDLHPDRTDLARSVERWPGREDLLGVVDFVRREQKVPAHILVDDALDELTILGHLEREVLRRRHYAIRLARTHQVTWSAIARALRLRSPQAAEQAALRLADLFDGEDGTRDDTAARKARRRQPVPAPTPVRDSAADALRGYLGQLYARLDELPEDVAEDVHAIRREASGTGPLPDATRSALGLIVRELLGSDADPTPAGTALAARHLGIPAHSML